MPPENTELREALARAIVAIRSRLFQALLGMSPVLALVVGKQNLSLHALHVPVIGVFTPLALDLMPLYTLVNALDLIPSYTLCILHTYLFPEMDSRLLTRVYMAAIQVVTPL